MPLLNGTEDNELAAAAEKLWCPSFPERTQIHRFKTTVSQKYGIPLVTYDDLWHWSVSEPAKFWEETWNFTGIRGHRTYDRVCGCCSNVLHYRVKGIAELGLRTMPRGYPSYLTDPLVVHTTRVGEM